MDARAPAGAAAGTLRGRRPAILFDEDFDAPPRPAGAGVTVLDDPPDDPPREPAREPARQPPGEPPAPPPPPAITAADLAAARAEAYAEGHGRGLAQAAADRAEVTRQMVSAIADRLQDARREAARVAEESAEAVARLMMGTLMGLLPALCARHGEAEVAALARAVLPALVREPRVTIRLSPHVLPAVEQAIAGLDPELHGRVVLVPTDAVPPGDARIAWADGAAVRDAGAMRQAIAEALAPLGLLAPQEAVPA